MIVCNIANHRLPYPHSSCSMPLLAQIQNITLMVSSKETHCPLKWLYYPTISWAYFKLKEICCMRLVFCTYLVSTFSILSASQLAFLAFFSSFLDGQKLTFPVINSLALTFSILLVSQNYSETSLKVSRQKQVLGFSCTHRICLVLPESLLHKCSRIGYIWIRALPVPSIG